MSPTVPDLSPTERNGHLLCGEVPGASIEHLPACLSNHCRIDAVQLENGLSCCDVDYASCARVAIVRLRVTRSLHFCGAMTGDWLALGLLHGADDNPRAGEGHLYLAWPGVPFDWFLGAGQTLLLVLTERATLLDRMTATDAGHAARELVQSGSKTAWLRSDGKAMDDERAGLEGLLDDALRGGTEKEGPLFASEVLDAMIAMLDSAKETGKGHRSARTLVRRACRVAGATTHRMKVAAVCRDLRVSPRTLHKAFVEVTGVGPHAYFLRQRLNAARRILADADPRHATVSAIALELGFTELGRFAGRYRAYFGEPPSKTLQRPRNSIKPIPA